MMLGISQSLVDIRKWRREAQNHHANACQQGDCLLLTSSLRFALDGTEEMNVMKEPHDEEDKLSKQQKILSQITEYRRKKLQNAELLRAMKLI
jgi:transposase-like protein